jgi:hypothetical protein
MHPSIIVSTRAADFVIFASLSSNECYFNGKLSVLGRERERGDGNIVNSVKK